MGRRRGFRDVYMARVTKNSENEYVCEKPEKLWRAIHAKLKVKRSIEKVFSDDALEETISNFECVEVEFEGNYLTMDKIAKLRGAKLEKGLLIDNKDDESSEIALGFRAKTGEGKYQFIWLYCGKFDGDDEDDYETTGDKIKTQTAKLKGTFYARELDGDYRVRVHESELLESDTDAKTAIQKWFTEVPKQTTVQA